MGKLVVSVGSLTYRHGVDEKQNIIQELTRQLQVSQLFTTTEPAWQANAPVTYTFYQSTNIASKDVS